MKVRVKKGKTGFIYGALRTSEKNSEFTLENVEHSIDLDDNGKPVIITPDQQFSKEWMEEVSPKKKEIKKPATKKN